MRALRFTAVPGSVLAALAAGVSLLTFAGSYSLMDWAYADWVAVSATSREALAYAGPFSAAMGAWVAGRYLRPQSIMCPPSASRSGRPVVAAQLRALAGAALLGWLAGYAPVFVTTALRATYGGPNVLVILGSATVLIAFVGVGYLVGCVAPRPVSAVASAVLAFTIILMVDTWGPAVAPLRLSTPAAGHYETGVVSAFRIAFFLMLFILLGASATRITMDRSVSRQVSAFAGLLLLLPPAILGGVARTTAPASVSRETHPTAQCATVSDLRVCVHPAKSSLLGPFANTVNRVMRSVNYSPAAPITAVVDGSLRSTYPAAGTEVVFVDLQTDPGYDWRAWAAGDLALELSGRANCPDRRGDLVGDQVAPAMDKSAVSEALAMWIAKTAGYDTPQLGSGNPSGNLDLFSASTPDKVQALYHQYSSQIAQCELPSSLLQ